MASPRDERLEAGAYTAKYDFPVSFFELEHAWIYSQLSY